ncbi:hypothetical protein Cob_v008274 [Colletotrichum orbiculare MAFF 240422]|uniref:Uncharacterized protein n=1 Tax=Colletotrichum orbiculare (strain 104-T / ATCC 96160 / CBS 514.97 / LARS 414 / MAFF 240422) TaxID=1213857 RepID=A0A484FM95_COLOR|nr:hypothetical protein Cob_v008274 [Colletotrichum orbiculare MAFF 240422]
MKGVFKTKAIHSVLTAIYIDEFKEKLKHLESKEEEKNKNCPGRFELVDCKSWPTRRHRDRNRPSPLDVSKVCPYGDLGDHVSLLDQHDVDDADELLARV